MTISPLFRKRGFEHACEEIIGRYRAPHRFDRRIQRKNRRWIIRCRIVVRDAAAERAHMAHGWIADHAGKFRKRRNDTLHIRRLRNRGMCRARADGDAGIVRADERQILQLRNVDEFCRTREPHFHRSDERLPARKQFRIRRLRETVRCILQRFGAVVGKWIWDHAASRFAACDMRLAASSMDETML